MHKCRHASLRLFGSFMILHENHYIGRKNSARYIPQRGTAANVRRNNKKRTS
jgi:hypothetical protein